MMYFEVKMAKGVRLLAGSPASAKLSPMSTRNSDQAHWHEHIWGVLLICVLTFLMVVSFFFFFKRKLFPFLRQRHARKGSLKAERLKLRRFQLWEVERATKNFSEECLLGFGAFGKVYKGTFDVEGTVLAIKRAHAGAYESVEEFRNEVRLLAQVRHRNLVSLVGFCEEPGAKGAKVLVYEYVPHGSLLEYIMGRGRRSLTWRQRVTIAIGAAKGIAHLHDGVKPGIIHRDIKPSNILIGDGFEAKVSDFGLVKLGPVGDRSHVSTQIKGTPGYLDPAYCSSLHLSPLSDVYSFGVILLQLVAARPAVDITRNQSNCHIIDWVRPCVEEGNVGEVLDANLLMEPCTMELMLKMAQLALRCVANTPRDRPTMTQVWQELVEALCSADILINKHPSMSTKRLTDGSFESMEQGHSRSMEYHNSLSFVSVDEVRFQRFLVEMDSVSFRSTNLRCLEACSISFEVDKSNMRGIKEDKNGEETS